MDKELSALQKKDNGFFEILIQFQQKTQWMSILLIL